MEQAAENERITSNPRIFGGKPIVRGTRITVELIDDWISSGIEPAEILVDYPNLTQEDIDAALAFAHASQQRSANAT